MAQPSAPPPYDDKNPLYPPPPGGYPQPPHYAGGYSQPGGYPAAGGYMPPGGYPAGGGYPQPGMAMPTMPVRFGKWGHVRLFFLGGVVVDTCTRNRGAVGGGAAHSDAEGCPPPQVTVPLVTAPPSNQLTGITAKSGTPSSAR